MFLKFSPYLKSLNATAVFSKQSHMRNLRKSHNVNKEKRFWIQPRCLSKFRGEFGQRFKKFRLYVHPYGFI